MKIAVSAVKADKKSQVDPFFGRCSYFGIFDTDTGGFEFLPNQAGHSAGGAGVQSAQLLADNGAVRILTGNIGPKAFQALKAAKIEIVTGVTGTVAEVVGKSIKGDYEPTGQATVQSHFGLK